MVAAGAVAADQVARTRAARVAGAPVRAGRAVLRRGAGAVVAQRAVAALVAGARAPEPARCAGAAAVDAAFVAVADVVG